MAVEAVLAPYDGWLCRCRVMGFCSLNAVFGLCPFAREWDARSVVPSPRLDQTSEDVQMLHPRYSMLYCVQLQSVHWLNLAVAFPRHQARRRAGARGVEAAEWLAVSSCLPQYQVVSNELLKAKTKH